MPPEPTAVTDRLVVPRFGEGCVTDLVPALLEGAPLPILPEAVTAARAVVLVVFDGLGWHQLSSRPEAVPTLGTFAGGPITTVAPSTTATALTSIATGTPPGEHGVIGYRMHMRGEVLNVLRWATARGDARSSLPPEEVQTVPAFLGRHPAVVTRTEFAASGFTRAHLEGGRLSGYRTASTLVVETARLVAEGERFVYAYWDGIDKVAHEYGLGPHHDAELRACDRMVADLLESLPAGTAVVVTADHGLIDSSEHEVEPDRSVLDLVASQSGEARFRWLHARPGRLDDLVAAAEAAHGHQAWIRTAEQMIDEGWFGPRVSDAARRRLGDVALVARGRWAFLDPVDTGPFVLIGRHGSLTPEEMEVPALALVT